jgi:hypothetical protein
LVRKTTQDKRTYEEQECERSVSEDWWNAKIGEKQRLVENELLVESEDWWKTNVGVVLNERSLGG